MNKLFIIAGIFLWIILVVFFSFNQGRINQTIAGIKGYSTVCIDGVNYLQFPSGASVKFNPDGKISTCNL